MHCVHVSIRGRVQGVGFRYFARHRAVALGLSGWVRNREDGSVEVEAEGDRAALEALVGELRTGPPGAQVRDFQHTWSERIPRHRGFEVKG
jgi:acylphosphatase